MAKIARFEDLIAWQKARKLCAAIYSAAATGGLARDFGFRNQICNAAHSIPSNIAEGFERNRLREFHQFLSVAKASCAETRSDLYLALDLGYIEEAKMRELMDQAEETARVIGGLRRSLERAMRRSVLRTQHSALRT